MIHPPSLPHQRTHKDEAVYPGKSPWKTCAKLLLGSVAVAGVAAALAWSDELRERIRVDATAVRWAAGLAGGLAATLLVWAVGIWHTRLKWVGVSAAGIRWHAGRRIKTRPWAQFARIRKSAVRVSVFGEDTKTGQCADIEFRDETALRVSPENVYGYEDLIAEIQTGELRSVRLFTAGSRPGDKVAPAVFGPLRIDGEGLEWDGVHRPWDAIENYEVAVGYLRIQLTDGTEFFRRLIELGDWRPAVARLDNNVGHRRVGQPASPVAAR